MLCVPWYYICFRCGFTDHFNIRLTRTNHIVQHNNTSKWFMFTSHTHQPTKTLSHHFILRINIVRRTTNSKSGGWSRFLFVQNIYHHKKNDLIKLEYNRRRHIKKGKPISDVVLVGKQRNKKQKKRGKFPYNKYIF